MMKLRMLLIASLFAASACDKGDEATAEASSAQKEAAEKMGVPSKEEIDKEVEKGVDDVLKKKGPKWSVTYKGDLEGKVEGGILAATKVSVMTTAHGGAMSPDMKSKANQSITVRMAAAGDKTPEEATVELKLADGTRCFDVTKDDGARSELELINADPKKLHAKIKGQLNCGEAKDKKIQYEGVLNKDK